MHRNTETTARCSLSKFGFIRSVASNRLQERIEAATCGCVGPERAHQRTSCNHLQPFPIISQPVTKFNQTQTPLMFKDGLNQGFQMFQTPDSFGSSRHGRAVPWTIFHRSLLPSAELVARTTDGNCLSSVHAEGAFY